MCARNTSKEPVAIKLNLAAMGKERAFSHVQLAFGNRSFFVKYLF